MRARGLFILGFSLAGLLQCGGGGGTLAPAPSAEEEESATEPNTPAGAGGTAAGAGGSSGGSGVVAASGGSAGECASGESAPSCVRLEPAPAPARGRCGDGAINRDDEQCDGSVLPPTAPPGSTCNANCTLQLPGFPRCGDGAFDPGEDCDGAALPASAPTGSQCSVQCTLIPPEQTECGGCAAANCALQRADLEGDLPAAEPLIECLLGAGWQSGTRAPKVSCANGELFTSCYCGSSPAEQCFAAPASAATGPCSAQILAATACDAAAADSSCPALKVLDPSNTSGKVMQYVQCQQDFCFEQCFNL